MNNDIMFRIKVGKICREILHDKGKSKKVVMAEFLNRKKEMTDYPKITFARIEPLQDYFDDGEGNRWSVARLIDDTKHLKPFNAPLACIDLSGRIWSECNMFGLAFHCKKVMDADLTKPIIISWDGSIADGRHRVIKALALGKKTIKAVRMTWKPAPCSTGNN